MIKPEKVPTFVPQSMFFMEKIRLLILMLLLPLAVYTRSEIKPTYRVEVGYIQPYQHGEGYRTTYFHGGKIGATVDFDIKYDITIQTGLYYSLAYGMNRQSYPHPYPDSDIYIQDSEYVNYCTMLHQLDVPVRLTYSLKIWKDLRLFAFAGPTFQIGLSQLEEVEAHLSDIITSKTDIVTGTTDLYKKKILPFNFMLGAGGGIQWKNYRLQAGFDFGLNNLYRNEWGHKMNQWNWFTSFSYAF